MIDRNLAESKFWAWVNKEGVGGCWIWTRCKNAHGYGVCSGFRSRLAHRASWEMANGEIPEGKVLDHLCHNASCVNPGHLRVCTQGENSRNQSLHKNNTSGAKGVFWAAWAKRWRVLIMLDRKSIHVGYYKNKDDATVAYAEASARLHGEFKAQEAA